MKPEGVKEVKMSQGSRNAARGERYNVEAESIMWRHSNQSLTSSMTYDLSTSEHILILKIEKKEFLGGKYIFRRKKKVTFQGFVKS